MRYVCVGLPDQPCGKLFHETKDDVDPASRERVSHGWCELCWYAYRRANGFPFKLWPGYIQYGITPTQLPCCVCGVNWVFVSDGYDTCDTCVKEA